MNPNRVVGYDNLGKALMKARRREEGIQQFQKAIGLQDDYAEAYFHLGLAYSEVNRKSEAAVTLEKALSFAKAQGNAELIKRIEGRIDAFRTGKTRNDVPGGK